MSAPVLGGVTLPLPNGYTRTPERVAEDRQLADGTLSTYHRGTRYVWALTWTKRREALVALVETLARLRTVTQYVDTDGKPYTVLVTGGDAIDPVPGTDPVVYSVGLTITERRPR